MVKFCFKIEIIKNGKKRFGDLSYNLISVLLQMCVCIRRRKPYSLQLIKRRQLQKSLKFHS